VKRMCWLFLTLALAGPGCLHLPSLTKDEAPPPAVSAPAPAPAPAATPPIVRPEQVTEQNAHEQLKALKAEIDHDLKNQPAAEGP
jgi:hypothetical protein